MSFSSDTKAELCKSQITDKCCACAEMYGVFMYCNTFSDKEVKIVTESREFAQRLPRLMKKAFGFGFDRLPENEARSKKLVFGIESREKLKKIFENYGNPGGANVAHHINFGVIEEDCCRQSFIKGAFLAGGSVTDPKKGYHLELVTDHYNVSREIHSILLDMEFSPKTTDRNGNYIIYFKQSEVIEDFLTTIGAPLAAMNIMSAKIEKDMYNSVNRKVNCDTANVTKTVEAAAGQLRAIQALKDSGELEELPEKLRETARLRSENPELSLAQLAELFSPPLTKSCLSHRLKKLTDTAEKLAKQ